MNKEQDIKSFIAMVIASIAKGKVKNEIEIDNIIHQLATLPLFENLNKEDLHKIRNEIHAECSIQLDNGIGIISKGHKKWFKSRKVDLDMDYWNRYEKYLLNDKGFSPNVINTMDEVSDELVDLLGDPKMNARYQRRGLIIGDVQSGKTANYTGLICKAADSGYKVIVLLTGTIEKLRKQTQMRLDEGFIGMDSSAMIKQKENIYIGVGKYNSNLHPMVLTSKMSDFNTRLANNLGFTLGSLKEPVLFVVKKNVSVLNKLNSWLKTFNLNGNKKIDTSLLVVDDEADNASINTNPEDRDPTKTNAQITELLGLFTKASYVGFTATPFANIFIDPDTDEEMKTENLFPKDYIYSLNAPTNYIGARNIFPEEAEHSYMLKKIPDGEIYFPLSHKIDYEVKELSPSLKTAINLFLISNTIRDLRNDTKAHRSMIINVSRFTRVQEQIGELVNEYLKGIQDSTRLFGKLEEKEALRDEKMKKLYYDYKNNFKNSEFSWRQIQSNIAKSISVIEVLVINQKTYGSLNYEENEETGLRAIVIGGLSLSRGLTLEGLMTSYFYRNSKMYDTLMQMGRWFGYRKNYDDLCTIWMDEDNIEWYRHINEATDELRREIKRMRDIGATPLDFGLRVRNDSETLLVTARNKMRTSKEITKNISLSGEYIETPKLYKDYNKNKQNLMAIQSLIRDINNANIQIEKYGNSLGYKNIDKDIIIKLLKSINVSYANIKFDPISISDFIDKYNGNELKKWDVVFISGNSSIEYEVIPQNKIKLVERNYIIKKDLIQISGSKNRLGGASDSKFGLTENEFNIIKAKFYSEPENVNKKTIPQKVYFNSIESRNPLLIVYLIELKGEETEIKEELKGEPLVGLGIGIPILSDEKTKYAHYQFNKIAQAALEEDGIGDEE